MAGIETTVENGVLRVFLNRPDVHNAMNAEMIAELSRIFKGPEKDDSIRLVHLSGNGKSFCAGADLNYMKSMAGFDLKENQEDAENLFEMFAAVRNCPVPVLARIHGSVMGGASGLAAACDYVILVGPKQTQAIQDGLQTSNYPEAQLYVARNLNDANDHLRPLLRTGDIVLYENDLPPVQP